jgi:hypothetical protein
MSNETVADRVGEQVLSAVKRLQDLSVSTVQSVTQAVAGFVPELPSLPLADRLPQPKEVAERTFGFWEELLEAQKEYTLRLIEAFEPLTGKVDQKAARARKKISEAKAQL